MKTVVGAAKASEIMSWWAEACQDDEVLRAGESYEAQGRGRDPEVALQAKQDSSPSPQPRGRGRGIGVYRRPR